MDLDKRLEDVTVLGPGGKMGSGIALLLAVEMTKRKLAKKAPDTAYRLHLIGRSEEGLRGLGEYLRVQSLKQAEKITVALRALYADREDLVENGEIIEEFVRDVGKVLHFTTDLTAAKGSHLVFEAIVENQEVKLQTYRKLAELCAPDTFFLTNTSSIPIGVLDKEARLDGRIVGYHFYNPPAVQKLVELISPKGMKPELATISQELGKALKKTLIPSNDIVGFIGNGHFTRDGLHAISQLEKLRKDGMSYVEALWAMNKVSQDFLVRPMGIFQLIDYVGIDVYVAILKVMEGTLKQGLKSELSEKMLAKGVKGGQTSSGSQLDGFLRYDKGAPTAVYDVDSGKYVALDPKGWSGKVETKLGATPKGWMPWKKWSGMADRETTLMTYLDLLWSGDGLGVKLARAYALSSAKIAENLVKDGVARNIDDVNSVLTLGFFHAYGPMNPVAKKRLTEVAR
jgi:3-hydroxyacyl-CoA dehydrogenase